MNSVLPVVCGLLALIASLPITHGARWNRGLGEIVFETDMIGATNIVKNVPLSFSGGVEIGSSGSVTQLKLTSGLVGMEINISPAVRKTSEVAAASVEVDANGNPVPVAGAAIDETMLANSGPISFGLSRNSIHEGLSNRAYEARGGVSAEPFSVKFDVAIAFPLLNLINPKNTLGPIEPAECKTRGQLTVRMTGETICQPVAKTQRVVDPEVGFKRVSSSVLRCSKFTLSQYTGENSPPAFELLTYLELRFDVVLPDLVCAEGSECMIITDAEVQSNAEHVALEVQQRRERNESEDFSLGSSVDRLEICMRLVNINLSSGGATTCPSKATLVQGLDRCCIKATVWQISSPIHSDYQNLGTTGTLLSNAMIDANADGIPSGTSCVGGVVHNIFCAKEIGSGHGGDGGVTTVMVTPNAIILDRVCCSGSDPQADDNLMLHEAGHLLGLYHSDQECTYDMCNPADPSELVSELQCEYMRASANAQYSGALGTCSPSYNC